ncbi:MAG TPA: hypothetical protein VEQ66_06405 [Propionibacteriaceae bacterium]|nr:hypothetical protein [Propionibacteriaceae bacterium]
MSRRTLLQGALASTVLAVTGAGTFSLPALAASYGPRSISRVGDYGYPPDHLNYRMWNFSSGTTLSAALAKMGPNDCLVLPERTAPYLIDTSRGFGYPGTSSAMARVKGGIYGMGPGAVIQYAPSGFSQGRASGNEGNINRVLECYTPGAYFGNFTMRGRSLGGCGFDAIKAMGNNTVFENLRFVGAHRGWRNSPPGETAAISTLNGRGMAIRNVEIDCRNANGARVGTSPLMLNQQAGITVTDVWAHHSLAGGVSGWRLDNATLRRVRSEHNGSSTGSLNGNAFNFEQSTGTILLDRCTFVCDYGPTSAGGSGNTGVHLAVGSYFPNPARIRVVSPANDRGPYRGAFAVHMSRVYGGTTQTYAPSLIRVVNSSGSPLAWKHN